MDDDNWLWGCLGIVLGIALFVSVCMSLTALILFVSGILFVVSVFIGVIGGAVWGLVKSIINYFAALHRELRFERTT